MEERGRGRKGGRGEGKGRGGRGGEGKGETLSNFFPEGGKFRGPLNLPPPLRKKFLATPLGVLGSSNFIHPRTDGTQTDKHPHKVTHVHC